jgi:hypothetical protein
VADRDDPAVEPLMLAFALAADRGSYKECHKAVIEAVRLLRAAAPQPCFGCGGSGWIAPSRRCVRCRSATEPCVDAERIELPQDAHLHDGECQWSTDGKWHCVAGCTATTPTDTAGAAPAGDGADSESSGFLHAIRRVATREPQTDCRGCGQTAACRCSPANGREASQTGPCCVS